MADPRIRQMKIKTGVVKRLAKDKVMYEQEVKDQMVKIEKLKEAKECEHVIRKQIEVLQESQMMVPDCKVHIARAYKELVSLMETADDLTETEEFKQAKSILDSVDLED
ncbi:hypothetical protein NHX12_027214 [Muraenolepis orangiensis]|uniref:Tubulin-specific chaperone A n=1 Tax=Muraenolepis orangiensis TaxID=630683 RepID=A0A9Q0ED60_9TELE|nr:hypothetical protein NHX12_027214 [Muraenolepis orangiensis]